MCLQFCPFSYSFYNSFRCSSKMLSFPIKIKVKRILQWFEKQKNRFINFPFQPGSLQLCQQAHNRKALLFQGAGETALFNSVTKETLAVLAVEMEGVFFSVQNKCSRSLAAKHQELYPERWFFSLSMKVKMAHIACNWMCCVGLFVSKLVQIRIYGVLLNSNQYWFSFDNVKIQKQSHTNS